tara:strand:+ start:1054 stop:1950 length:897 start_codon:yes stop_codon:yes gene_type:complete
VNKENNTYILCEDIFKIYKIAELEVVALRGLDLEVNQGEVVAIVGASGSGKSTLLNIIAGYDIPSAGKVEVAGNDLSKLTVKEVESYRRSEIGFIWQQAVRNLFPYLTAQENVELPMLLSGISSKQRKEHSLYLLNLVGLDHRLSHTPQKLSGGEQQRVAIAVALANQPKLLLADEPTGELDRKTANTVLELLNKLNSELKTTLVIVTHDPEIMHQVPRVVTIRDGKASSEIVNLNMTEKSFAPSPEKETTYVNYTLLDRAGRMQIPREYVQQFKINQRVKLSVVNDHLVIMPDSETS